MRSARALPPLSPPHLYLELKDPAGVHRPQGLLEGLSVAKHPKVFPLEFHFLSVSKVFLWMGPL